MVDADVPRRQKYLLIVCRRAQAAALVAVAKAFIHPVVRRVLQQRRAAVFAAAAFKDMKLLRADLPADRAAAALPAVAPVAARAAFAAGTAVEIMSDVPYKTARKADAAVPLVIRRGTGFAANRAAAALPAMPVVPAQTAVAAGAAVKSVDARAAAEANAVRVGQMPAQPALFHGAALTAQRRASAQAGRCAGDRQAAVRTDRHARIESSLAGRTEGGRPFPPAHVREKSRATSAGNASRPGRGTPPVSACTTAGSDSAPASPVQK